MREGYRRLTKTIREGLLNQFLQDDNHRQDRSQIDTIICVEMMLIGFDLATGISDATEAWAIIPGYNVFNYKSQHAEGVVGRLRILFGFYRAESRWLKDLEQYAQIDQNYRLFSLTENQEFSEGHVRYVPERKELYLKLLQNTIPHRQNEQTFSSPGDFFYERFEDQEKVRREGKLPDLNQSRLVFPLYRDKKEIICDFKSDWDGLVEELTIIAPQENWSQRFQTLEILPLTEHQVFNYRGVNHIAGGLGTGKSTFRVLETYRLVQKHQARVGMIEGSVAEVNKRVRELEQLGLKAVPIIGTSNRKKHLNNYLAAASGSIVELSDWAQEERSALAHLTGKCYVHALCSDYTTEHLPCNELYQGKKRVMCSMAQICGVYEDFRQLLDADVWVTTSAAVLITRLPGMLDPYQRRIFEAMYDLLDVIFVDEADLVQEQFDSTFIEEYDLFGSPHHLFEELQIEVLAKVSGRYSAWAGNSLITNFRKHVGILSDVIWKIYELLEKSARLRSHLRSRKVFHIYALAHELTDKLTDNPAVSKKIWNQLRVYISNPQGEDCLSKTAEALLNLETSAGKSSIIQACISSLTAQLAPKVHQELLQLQLEFFIYLGRFEHELKYILQDLDLIHEELNISTSLGKIFSMRREYAAFLKDSMTGMLVGYRYLPKEQDLGAFKFFEYSGVGRLLLQEWSHVYKAVDQLEGPGVVLLSGTSYAPGSRHHDLQIPVDWLMKSVAPAGQLTQFYHPIFDPQTGEEIYVSGVANSEERGQRLEKEVELLKPLLQHELDHWEKDARRVLLVVNSYEDLNRVAQVLDRDSLWQKRFKILSRDMDAEKSDYSFPVATINQFRDDPAEILVAPLLAMNRGHNILDEYGGALFGSVFFLIRPYPVPDDLGYIIKSLHAQLPDILADIELEKLSGSVALRKLRKESIRRLEMMVRKPDFWSILSTEQRRALSWFILIPIWQMIGRLIRGNRDARVFYVDAKFGMEPKSGKRVPPLLSYWQDLFKGFKRNDVVQALYGPFSSSLPELKSPRNDNKE